MFIWDRYNRAHVAAHGLSVEEVEEALLGEPFDVQQQYRNGEPRLLHLGETLQGKIIFVVTTQRHGKVRVVTAFPANRPNRKLYADLKKKSELADPTSS